MYLGILILVQKEVQKRTPRNNARTDRCGPRVRWNFCLYFDIKIILRFPLILKWFLFSGHFVQTDQMLAIRLRQRDNHEGEDFSNFALASEIESDDEIQSDDRAHETSTYIESCFTL